MIITLDGNYSLMTDDQNTDGDIAVLISGAIGAASATFTYKDAAGNYIPLTDDAGTPVAPTTGQQYRIARAFGVKYFLTVTGADGATAIDLTSVGAAQS